MKGSLPWKIMLKECKRFALPFPYSPLFLSLSPSIYILSLLPSPLFFIYVHLISLSSLPPSIIILLHFSGLVPGFSLMLHSMLICTSTVINLKMYIFSHFLPYISSKSPPSTFSLSSPHVSFFFFQQQQWNTFRPHIQEYLDMSAYGFVQPNSADYVAGRIKGIRFACGKKLQNECPLASFSHARAARFNFTMRTLRELLLIIDIGLHKLDRLLSMGHKSR